MNIRSADYHTSDILGSEKYNGIDPVNILNHRDNDALDISVVSNENIQKQYEDEQFFFSNT